jgi:hypothetical protein
MDPDYAAAMGRYVMAINSLPRLQKFGVVHGRRRMLGPKTPRPALDLKIVENSK